MLTGETWKHWLGLDGFAYTERLTPLTPEWMIYCVADQKMIQPPSFYSLLPASGAHTCMRTCFPLTWDPCNFQKIKLSSGRDCNCLTYSVLFRITQQEAIKSRQYSRWFPQGNLDSSCTCCCRSALPTFSGKQLHLPTSSKDPSFWEMRGWVWWTKMFLSEWESRQSI